MRLIKRILFLVFLINSHIVFADTIAASSSSGLIASVFYQTNYQSYTRSLTQSGSCSLYNGGTWDGSSCSTGTVSGTACNTGYTICVGTIYTCPSGYFNSDSSGNVLENGAYCTTDIDPCDSLKGQQIIINALYPFGSSTCVDSCTAAIGGYTSDGKSAGYYYPIYATYTGLTCTGSEDVQSVDASTADASNTAKAEADRIAKEEATCGGAGYYTTGEVNGKTTVVCTTPVNEQNSSSSTTTSTQNEDGSTTTTTTTTETKDNTTTNPDGSQSGGSTTTTRTTVTTTYPDGSSTTSTTETVSGSEATGSTTSGAECTDPAGCDEFDSSGLQASLQNLIDEDSEIQALISAGGPGLPVAGFGFGTGDSEGDGSGSWFWPVGSCSSPAITLHVGQMSDNMDLSEFCIQWNSVANPVISWMIRILTMIYIFFLWDKTISDLSKIK